MVEVQRRYDPEKRFSWPCHLVLTRARERAPVVLFVLCRTDALATRYADPIQLDLGRSVIAPIVLGPGAVPRPTVGMTAEQIVLSCLAHGASARPAEGLTLLGAAATALATLDDLSQRDIYFDLCFRAVTAHAQRLWENLMEIGAYPGKGEFWRVTTAAIERGIARRSRAEGVHEGIEKGLRSAIRTLLTARGESLSNEALAAIEAEGDAAVLREWIAGLASGKRLDDLVKLAAEQSPGTPGT